MSNVLEVKSVRVKDTLLKLTALAGEEHA